MRRTDGELILLWTLPVLGIIWLSVFLLFPGFVHPMSPTMSAEEVAAFYRDPENLPRIRYSMIVFNWFAVGLIPFLALIVMQIRRMAHRTPIFSYSHHRVRGRRPHDLSRGRPVLAPRCLPPGTGPTADPTVQRSRVGDLRQPGRIPDRAERDPRPGDLPRPPGPTGLQAMGRAFQSSHRRRDGPRFLRGAGNGRPHRLGRPADLLGPKRRDRPLDRRHGRRSRPGDPSTAGRREAMAA